MRVVFFFQKLRYLSPMKTLLRFLSSLSGCLSLLGTASGESFPDASSRDGELFFSLQRHKMVEEQLRSPGRGLKNDRVLESMRRVPRHLLIPQEIRPLAYSDRPLPIGYGQTISQPFIVGFMTEKLDPQPGDRVLEIGTGSGYQAAVLAELVDKVYTIEIVPELARQAAKDLADLGYKNVFVRKGDGFQGWPEEAPFDAIIVTCAPENVPPPLVAQLKEGGKMIIPVGGASQSLFLFTKRDGQLHQQAVLPVRFVPMTGPSLAPGGSN